MDDKEAKTLAVLEERVKQWMDTTVDYRRTLCSKLEEMKNENRITQDKIFAWLESLPCKERKGWYNSMDKQVKTVWLALTLFAGLIGINMWFGMRERSEISNALHKQQQVEKIERQEIIDALKNDR